MRLCCPDGLLILHNRVSKGCLLARLLCATMALAGRDEPATTQPTILRPISSKTRTKVEMKALRDVSSLTLDSHDSVYSQNPRGRAHAEALRHL